MTLARTLSLACLLVAVSFNAEARTRAVDVSAPAFDRHTGNNEIGSRMFIRDDGARRIKVSFRHVRNHRTGRLRADRGSSHASYGEAQIVAHPSGCPARAFCGCGASIEVFGHSVRELWLASNWFRFPRAAPAPGMAAVRNHHVFIIREVRGNGMVLAYDANSGGRQTRVHLRSLAGYTVVNPRGSRYATAE